MFKSLRSLFFTGYQGHKEAVIVSCFYNPQNSEYRKKAFDIFYKSIKHLNYRIIECGIGNSESQLSHYKDKNIDFVTADELLWHKETLLNKAIAKLPPQYKYVFWVDADVIFDSDYWLIDGVKALQTSNIIQPFEYCIHLEKDQLKPSFDYLEMQKKTLKEMWNFKMWRSFCSNVHSLLLHSNIYNEHGHVGFAWGARREIIEQIPLYEKALIGGADHIIAHAAANQINCDCISKTFTEDIDDVKSYMRKLSYAVGGGIGYCKGSLFHIWHGDIEKRQYCQRIKDFTPKAKTIVERDKNGFYKSDNPQTKVYVEKYYESREVSDDNFLTSAIIGYATDSTIAGTLLGGDLSGAIIGDMLNNNDNENQNNLEFGGGDFGGAGAVGSWEANTFS